MLFLKPCSLTSFSDLDHFLPCLRLALDWRSRLMQVIQILISNQKPDENRTGSDEECFTECQTRYI